jgi:putative ABC transport system permease protein
MLAFFAGVIAVILVELSLPAFNKLVSKTIFIPFANPVYWLVALGFIVFTGLLAGSYPALYLSSFKPVQVLKGTFKAANAQITPRKVLVIIQFTFAIALVICTLVVIKQIKHAQMRDAGYVKDNLIYVPLQGDINKHYDLIKNELLRKRVAVAVTKSMSGITSRNSDGWGFSWPGSTENDKKLDFVRMASDADFVKAMGVKLVQGRDIDIEAYPADSSALLLNESAVKSMRLKNPVGQTIKGDGREWRVVGVVKDFIFESPYEKVQQLMVFGPRAWFNGMHIKLNNQHSVAQNLATAEQIFKESNQQYPFEYKFMDEEYARKFRNEKRIGSLAGLFAGLTIFISCLGLFGLSTYMAENRIKEIGVRKVLGASVLNITALLSRDFLKLVVISILIASPIAWWMMNSWLEGYAYKISISVWIFAIAGLGAMSIALLTISFQSVKAAIANPIKNLRSE